jgi:branched-chain amino acid transport system ATP-binding protein
MMSDPILRLSNISKSFGGVKVLENVSFDVQKGSRHALIGPNGAGKTTLFNVISGIHNPEKGKVFFEEKDLSGVPSRKRIRRGLSRSFQNIRLMPHLSVLENVMLGQHSKIGFLDMIKPLSLSKKSSGKAEAIDTLHSFGIDLHQGQTVSSLPYGIRKKIEVVRALMAEPRLLLLDEPAAGLNTAETNTLREFLNEVSSRGITLLLVDHDMPFVNSLCTEVSVMNFGQLIYNGSTSGLKKDKKVLEAYLGMDENLEGKNA